METEVQQHATVDLAYKQETVPVDAKLAGVIQLIWDKGLSTDCSCEDIGGDIAYLNFPEYDEALVAFRTMANFARVHAFHDEDGTEIDVVVSMAYSSGSLETQIQFAPNTLLPELEKYMRSAWTGGETN